MKGYSSKLTNITKEFDELVKISNSILHPKLNSITDLFNIFKFQSTELLENQKKLYSLPLDQYFAVVDAANAIELFGKSEIGKGIYNRNKAAYFVSKKVNLSFK